jgi:class 3 adenylate cyclase/tetratricopeptide (TPR) repeat protein
VADEVDLPEGPVTVMFTDIEGSTALRTTLGDAAADLLFRQHDDVVREQIQLHRGHDLQAALGDGFLAVFVSTRRAVACAVAIQLAIDSSNHGRVGPALRVRVGLNTGEVAWQKGQPSGEAVHAAARVCAAAAGGEVFVSDVTRQLAGTVPDVTFTDRGQFDLKGFPEPWRLWALSWRVARRAPAEEVFVGRERELGELRARLADAIDGRGGVVLVGGEPGVGKTTLVRQLIKEAEQQGAVALFGRCYESDGTVPYSPFVETTEQALRLVPTDWVREDLGEDAAEVARMVPELRRRFPDIGEPLDLPPEQQRRYFFNAITDFIARAAERLPLVLVVDDAHWADEPTLLLIEHVAERLPHMRVLAIGTYRDMELDVSRPLAATLERLLRSRLAQRVGLKRFDRDGVTAILQAHAGATVTDELVDAIYEETEGNPFFVDEVFRHLDEEGKLFDERGHLRSAAEIGALEVPESVRLVVGRRVERLGPDAQRVLAAAAVVGRGFEFELLERIAGLDVGVLLDVVDEAERARVIVPEDRGSRVFYTFGHELIRQTLLAGLSSPRRQRIHLAVADALEDLDPTNAELRPSEIAAHLVQAGSAADPVRTAAFLRRAAERAFEAAAFEEALRSAEESLALLPAGDERGRLALLELVGWADRALGRFDRCLEVWERVVAGYAAAGEVEEAGRLLWETGYHLVWMGRFEEAAGAYMRALEILGDEGGASRAGPIGALAALTGLAGFRDAMAPQFEEALALAGAVDDANQLGRIYWGRAIGHFATDGFADSIVDGRVAVDFLRRAGDLWTLVDGLGWLGFALLLTGHGEEAHPAAAEAVELGERLGHRTGEMLARRVVVLADLAAGRLTPAELVAGVERDVQVMEAMASPWASQSHAWLGAVHTVQGRVEEGLAHIDIAVELEPASGFTGLAPAFRFLNRAYAGDRDACRALLDEHRAATTGPVTTGRAFLIGALAEGCAALGWADEVEPLYPDVCDQAARGIIRSFDLASLHRIAGMAAMTLGRWDDAHRHLADARHALEEQANEYDKPAILHRSAELAARDPGGPRDLDAGALVAAALDGYRRHSQVLHVASAEELARTLA